MEQAEEDLRRLQQALELQILRDELHQNAVENVLAAQVGGGARAPRALAGFGGGRDDFVTGLCFGLLLGLPAMLCLVEPGASSRLRAGICAGFVVQMLLASSRLAKRGAEQRSGPLSREAADAAWLDG
jgi:hypothetical protein